MLKQLFMNRYRIYLFAHILVIVLVTAFFKIIPERKIAALCAGTLFLLTPVLVLFFEYRAKALMKRMSSYGALIFLLLSAMPIFYLRVTNWSEDFNSLSLAGIAGPELHQLSNKIFMLMLVCFLVDAFREQIKKQKATE